MHGAHEFLAALATVLCVAAVTTVLFQRLRQPVVLGYILAGLIVGPHVPIPLVADLGVVQTLSELGVILLMFSLGLEFSFRKLLHVGPRAGVTAVIQSGIMVWLGYVAGRAFGWTPIESLFTGALIAISSTTIIAKVYDEQGVRGPLRDFVVGILIVEDLVAILLMTILTALAGGEGLTAGTLLASGGRLAGFLVLLMGVGMLVVPRAVRYVARLRRDETTLVAAVGLCFACALLAHAFGYSVALGAFLAGSLIAESGKEKRVEHLVAPLRDVFGAVFFVSVGMLLDPGLVAEHAGAVAALTALVIVGKVVGVSLGAFLTGSGVRTSVEAGMSLAQIGEFSFIIAGLGSALGATGEFLYPVAVSVAAITTLTTPWLIRVSGPAAGFLDRRMPASFQTFASLYGSWIGRLRAAPPPVAEGAGLRRLGWLLLLDAAALAGVIVAIAVYAGAAVAFLGGRFDLARPAAVTAVALAAAALAAPFAVGILRLAREFGRRLAALSLPEAPAGKADLAAAPRRLLVVALQLALVLVLGFPFLAITQPFLPWQFGAPILLLPLTFLGISFWRSARDLEGHVRAGSEAILEALAASSASGSREPDDHALDGLHAVLPGLGQPVPVVLGPASPAAGGSLADLDLRSRTGATVLALMRDGRPVAGPLAAEPLRAGDVLAVAGAPEAITAARALLGGEPGAE